jgi:hypothetical protein
MFAGHYAPALAAKRWFPEVPLWQLFVAVQSVDVLFFTLVPLGVEKLAIHPERPGLLAMELDWMPYSHSLVATAVYAAAVAAIGRDRRALALGLAVMSHWVLDLVVHTPDLPLMMGGGPRVGLGLWNWTFAAWGLELALLIGGLAVWGTRDQRVIGLVVALMVVQTLTVFVVPLPPTPLLLAITSQASYLGFAVAAYFAEPTAAPTRP